MVCTVETINIYDDATRRTYLRDNLNIVKTISFYRHGTQRPTIIIVFTASEASIKVLSAISTEIKLHISRKFLYLQVQYWFLNKRPINKI